MSKALVAIPDSFLFSHKSLTISNPHQSALEMPSTNLSIFCRVKAIRNPFTKAKRREQSFLKRHQQALNLTLGIVCTIALLIIIVHIARSNPSIWSPRSSPSPRFRQRSWLDYDDDYGYDYSTPNTTPDQAICFLLLVIVKLFLLASKASLPAVLICVICVCEILYSRGTHEGVQQKRVELKAREKRIEKRKTERLVAKRDRSMEEKMSFWADKSVNASEERRLVLDCA